MTEESSIKEIKDPNKITVGDVKLTVNRSGEIRSYDTIDIGPSEDIIGRDQPDENVDDTKPKGPAAKTTEQNEKVYRIEIISRSKPKSEKGGNPFSYTHKTHVIVAMAQGGDDGGGGGDERGAFIALVLMIVCFCLFVNVFCVYASTILDPVQDFLRKRFNRMILLIIGMIGLLAISYGLAYIPACSMPPCNIITLGLMVFFYTLILVVLVYVTKVVVVMFALGVLILIVMFGICVALFVPIDFTRCIVVVLGAMAALCLASMLLMLGRFFGPSSIRKELTWMKLIVAVMFIVVQTILFIIEIQMILGGRTIEMAESEFITAGTLVYSSIIQMFLQIVQILNLCEGLGLCSLDDVL